MAHPALETLLNWILQVSAGNSYMFGTSRSLYSLALAGQAPKVLRRLNRNGVPYLCVIVTSGLSLLSYLSVSAGVRSVDVLDFHPQADVALSSDRKGVDVVDLAGHCFAITKLDNHVVHLDSIQCRFKGPRLG